MMRMLSLAALLFSPTVLAQDGAVTLGTPVVPAVESAPDRYVIQAGDTLWDISTKFLGNSYYWPRLWSINDYITNPHWIYPGNVIVFRPGTLLEPPAVELEGSPDRGGYVVPSEQYTLAEPECGPDVRFEKELRTTTYIAPGFLGNDDLETWGKIYAAKPGNTMLGEGDMIYLELDDPDVVECGDVVAIYRKSSAVRHPKAKDVDYGNVYRVVGEARVVHREGDITTAVIRRSYFQAKRGDIVGPVFPVAAEMAVSAPKGDMDGIIVARLEGDVHSLGSVGETVFLDRGKADGLRVGNSFYVVHRRDENVGLDHYDPAIPGQVVGRLIVVRVDESTSTAVVVDAARQLKVGDEVRMSMD